jgi:urease accessory protein
VITRYDILLASDVPTQMSASSGDEKASSHHPMRAAPGIDNPPMLIVNKKIALGRGLAPVLLKRAASIELDWDTRRKSRFDATDTAGRRLGVFLPRGSVVRGGDVLVTEDGSLVRVVAAPQAVLRVSACPVHGTPLDLPRAAYHLGNRHVALEVQADHLQLEPDPVLASMLRSMHVIVDEVNAPFEPESGAYVSAEPAHEPHGAQDHGHAAHEGGHDHKHDDGHAHHHEH